MELVHEPLAEKAAADGVVPHSNELRESIEGEASGSGVASPKASVPLMKRPANNASGLLQKIDPIFTITLVLSSALMAIGLFVGFTTNKRIIDDHLSEIEISNKVLADELMRIKSGDFEAPKVAVQVVQDELLAVDLPEPSMVAGADVEPHESLVDLAAVDTTDNTQLGDELDELRMLLSEQAQQLEYLALENHELRLQAAFGHVDDPNFDEAVNDSAGSSHVPDIDAANPEVSGVDKLVTIPSDSGSSEPSLLHKQDINSVIAGASDAYHRQDYVTAGRRYEQALQIDPQSRDANLGVASVALIRDNTELAIDRYRHLLSLNPDDQIAFSSLLSLSAPENMIETELLTHVVQVSNDRVALYSIVGHHFGRAGRWQDANDSFANAVENTRRDDPQYPAADLFFNLAVSFEHLGRSDDAVENYLQALRQTDTASFDRALVRTRLKELLK